MNDVKIVHLKSNGQKLETWIAMINGEIVGHIYMEREENKKIKFLDAWVHDDHRRKGIFRCYGIPDGNMLNQSIQIGWCMHGVNQHRCHCF